MRTLVEGNKIVALKHHSSLSNLQKFSYKLFSFPNNSLNYAGASFHSIYWLQRSLTIIILLLWFTEQSCLFLNVQNVACFLFYKLVCLTSTNASTNAISTSRLNLWAVHCKWWLIIAFPSRFAAKWHGWCRHAVNFTHSLLHDFYCHWWVLRPG